MSIKYEHFILAKIWALLHDPPHKGLIVGEDSETNHEALAKEALRTFLGQSIPEIVEKIVSKADRFAASIEREISIYIKDFKNIRSRYINVLNMFDTRYRAYEEETLKKARKKGHEWFNKFLEKLCDLGEICRTLPDNIKYLILYTTLEAAWARTEATWVSPADTRYPTHTVFDHVYTTASMVNLFTVDETPTGYLIYFDIPSIQTFIGASRRSLDYWAGSMIISYITLKTFSELIEKIGPDIFISPSMRHNPLLKIELLESMIPRNIGELRDRIILTLSEYWSNLYTGKVPATIVMQPVMPGTALCILPKISSIEGLGEKLNIKEDNTEQIKKYIIDRFYTCWKDIINKVFDGLLDNSKIPNINKLIKIFEEYPFTTPRVVVIDLSELYREYCEKYGDSIRRILENFKDDLVNIDEAYKEFLIKLFYHVLNIRFKHICSIKSSLNEEYVLTLGEYIDEIDNIYRDHINNKLKANLRYCTVCRRFYALPLVKIDNNDRTRDIVTEEYVRYIKDTERLCYICLLKRFFKRKYIERVYEDLRKHVPDIFKPVPSNDFIANKYILNVVDEVVQKCAKNVQIDPVCLVAKVCDNVCDEDSHEKCILFMRGLLRYCNYWIPICTEDIYRDKDEFVYLFDYYHYGDSLSISRRRLTMYVSYLIKVFRDLLGDDEVIKDTIAGLIRNILCLGGDDYCSKNNELYYNVFSNVLKRFRAYYAIIKGDGDSVGDVISGRILRKPGSNIDLPSFEEYFENIANEVCPETNNNDSCRVGFRKLICILAQLKNILCEDSSDLDSLILSPTYHSVLSASLMITSLKDVGDSLDSSCTVIYAGGDDIAALCPVESSLKMIYETRRNYQALDEEIPYFHRLGNGASVIPTLTRFGRSYGVRIAHIMDPMQLELEKCSMVLEKFAKDSTWMDISTGTTYSKDTVAFSYGRGSEINSETVVKIPLKQDWKILELLSLLETCVLSRSLSHNLPYDFEMYLSSISKTKDVEDLKDSIHTLTSIAKYIIERNILSRNDIVEKLLKKNLEILCRIVEKYGDNTVRILLIHVIRLIAMFNTSIT